MSILQDLDPQYAKIHAQQPSSRKPFALAGGALVVLAMTYWAITKTQTKPVSTSQITSAYISQPPSMPEEPQKNTTTTSSAIVRQEIPYAMTRTPSISPSATIREEAERMAHAGQQTPVPAPSGFPESAAGSLADTEYRRQPQAATSHVRKKPGQAKHEHGRSATQATAKNEKNQLPSGKRTNERDIDIITAIVR